MNFCESIFQGPWLRLPSVHNLTHLGVAESLSNGTVGQFARRSNLDPTKMPYPPHEDKLEQERTERSLISMVEALPQYLEIIGNVSAEQAVCE